MPRRIEQIDQLLRKELSELLTREVEFPPGSLVTVTRAQTSTDLKSAKVWISILPIKYANRVLENLKNKSRQFERLLNKKLLLRSIPKINFLIDRNEEEASEIEALLDQIKKED